MLKLLGLIEPDVDLRSVSASVYEEGVAGYYDPRSKHLRIVKGTAPGALDDMVIAHELTHALEDQRFGLPSDQGGSDDRLLAALALGEGTAMVISQEYLQRHIGVEKALATLGAGLPSGPDLPEFLQAQLLFPYTGGMAFVQALRKRAGGSWKLVDLAERLRVPDSTEQVLHPEKWIEVEPPLPVPLDVSLGAGWRRVTSGTFGEWQTGQLLGDAAAAAGWGGDRYELWQRGACTSAPPCRASDVLVMRWRWDTPRDAREFETALRAAPVARVDGATIVGGGDTVTLVLSPSPELLDRVR